MYYSTIIIQSHTYTKEVYLRISDTYDSHFRGYPDITV